MEQYPTTLTPPKKAFAPLTEQEYYSKKVDAVEQNTWHVMIPVPKDAPPAPAIATSETRHTYHDSDGKIAFYQRRYDKPDGKKTFLPLSYGHTGDNKLQWKRKLPAAPRLLYHADKLTTESTKPTLVCEGEKATDAAQELLPDYICTTSPGGSASAGKADWSILKGRNVTIWPDADDSGRKYASDVARLVKDAGAKTVKILTPPVGVKEGWDAANAQAERWGKEQACQFIAQKTVADTPEEEKAPSRKQADILVDIAKEAHLFHSPDGIAFADVRVNTHRETWRVRSRNFKLWLIRRFYQQQETAPNSEALNGALSLLEAQAFYDGKEIPVHLRTAAYEEKLYIDLCDDKWRAIEIDGEGWQIIETPPVHFRRVAGMLPLPEPQCGGDITKLRTFLNVKTDNDFVLTVAWLLAALHPKGPYPVLALAGEQGAGKSTFARRLRDLIDPNSAALRSLPRDDRDLFIAANNGHIIAFDNLSTMPHWLSDALCRIATGGSFATRQLFTDGDETLFDATRPIVLNGIEEYVGRSDLADRSLFITLESIPEKHRKPERHLLAEFESEHARLFGALLDAMSHGLAALPHTQLDTLPRMADFAIWASACEGAFNGTLLPTTTEPWKQGTFLKLYNQNRDDATQAVIEGDRIASAMQTFMQAEHKAGRKEWEGNATALLAALSKTVEETVRHSKAWPQTPRVLSSKLRRAAEPLRRVGVDITLKHSGKRKITITYKPPSPSTDKNGNRSNGSWLENLRTP